MRWISRAWVAWALLAAASFAAMGACVRLASEVLPQSEVVFFRNFMALLFLLPLVIQRGVSLTTRIPGMHLLRGLTGLAAMYLYFYSLQYLPLSGALLLNYTSPLFIALFAVVWLKERLTVAKSAALLVGFCGVALLFTPSSSMASFAGLMGLASGALAGFALTTVKRLSATEPALRIVTLFALFASLVSAVPMVFVFQWPDLETWTLLIALGVAANAGQLGLTVAYSQAQATQVSPLGYATLLFAGLIGFVLWNEVPDIWGIMGALLVAAAGIMVVRERKEPTPEPPGAVPAVNSSNNHPLRLPPPQ